MKTTKSSQLIDLHGLYVGAGIIAVLWWLKECITPYLKTEKAEKFYKTKFYIITGWGKNSDEIPEGRMKKHIQTILILLGMKLVPTSNIGRLVLCPQTLEEII